MRTNRLLTSILAVTAIVVTSCSTPKLAQQSVDNDDVYNSNAQARVYTPAPIKPLQQTAQQNNQQYEEDDYYGTSDPYYDMDYSSRINRFSYGTPWRSYYDPFFYNDWYSPYSLGFNDFYGGGFGWGHLSSPFWSYSNFGFGFNNFGWGFNNFGWGFNNFYGGGLWGGGFLGGGYYGGGYYTGRTTNVPNYAARPYMGRENGVGTYRGMPTSSVTRRTDANGNLVRERSRSERYVPNNQNAPTRADRSTAPQQQARPARTQQAAPAQPTRTERPSYTPPARSEGRSSGSSGSSGARPARSGRG